MITKGTEQYKQAQQTANSLMMAANTDRWNESSIFELMFNQLAEKLMKVKSVDGFASQVATTVLDGMSPKSPKVAKMSDKQAWIIACSIIENNLLAQGAEVIEEEVEEELEYTTVYTVGEKVSHPKFGEGIVVYDEKGIVSLRFATYKKGKSLLLFQNTDSDLQKK